MQNANMKEKRYIIKLRWDRLAKGDPGEKAGHCQVSVFVASGGEHLANAGHLTLRYDEAKAFRESIRMGSGQAGVAEGFSGVLESGWKEDE